MVTISEFVDHFDQNSAFGLEVEKGLAKKCHDMLKNSSVKWFWGSRVKDAKSTKAKLDAKTKKRKFDGEL